MNLELLRLRLANKLIGKMEDRGDDKVIMFVPEDPALREMSEAMLIDGFVPSYINNAVLNQWQEKYGKRPRILAEYRPTRKIEFD